MWNSGAQMRLAAHAGPEEVWMTSQAIQFLVGKNQVPMTVEHGSK